MRTVRRLADAYRFPGFRPRATVRGVFGDPKARVLRLQRRGKKRRAAPAVKCPGCSTPTRSAGFGTCRVATPASTWRWPSAGCSAKPVGV
ncbi:MAG: hypothetical protein IH977_03665 [Nitrospinae bacterium]|nr:hypothetical protein [Nitrospinota bacterium]